MHLSTLAARTAAAAVAKVVRRTPYPEAATIQYVRVHHRSLDVTMP